MFKRSLKSRLSKVTEIQDRLVGGWSQVTLKNQDDSRDYERLIDLISECSEHRRITKIEYLVKF